MIPRILSLAGPLFVYLTLAVLLFGIWQQRTKFERAALIPALLGLIASFLFLPPIHRLFFDEDIYISMASNLSKAPIAQLTVLGGPDDVEVSSYYKSPVGWPVILSLVFLITGRSETVAFIVARIIFALAIAVTYHLARALLPTQRQAITAAVVFCGVPICFWYSVSAGTDLPAATFVTLGTWGLCTGNGALAAAGFALAAQTRLELLILVPMLLLARQIGFKWKLLAITMVAAEIVHVAWVLSVAPVLEEAEQVSAAFSSTYVVPNLAADLKYLFDPKMFPIGMMALGLLGMLRLAIGTRRSSPALSAPKAGAQLAVQFLMLFSVYLFFYAGSLDLNPRYGIQLLMPLAIFASSVVKRPVWIGALLASVAFAYMQPTELTGYLRALEADHRVSRQFASQLNPKDLVVSTEPEMFLNQGVSAMSAVYASERKARLDEKLAKDQRVLYHEGARTNVADTVEWRTNRWVKANFDLHLIDSYNVSGIRIAFYQLLPKLIDRKASLSRTLKG